MIIRWMDIETGETFALDVADPLVLRQTRRAIELYDNLVEL